MSPNFSNSPPDRSSRLPARYIARVADEEDIIDAEEIEAGTHWAGSEDVASIFANLWPDDGAHHDHFAAAPRSGETSPRPPKSKNQDRAPGWRDIFERVPKALQNELDEAPTEREVVWALIRDDSGWYIFLNHHYRKLIFTIMITLALFATGKISEAIELVFKLFF